MSHSLSKVTLLHSLSFSQCAILSSFQNEIRTGVLNQVSDVWEPPCKFDFPTEKMVA